MATDSNVTASDVREELNEVPADVISDTVIERQIGNAEIIVGEYAGDDADPATVDYAVAVVAAHGTLSSDSGGWQTVAAELDVREEYEVQGMVEELGARRAEALSLVSPDGGGPSLRSLGDRHGPR